MKNSPYRLLSSKWFYVILAATAIYWWSSTNDDASSKSSWQTTTNVTTTLVKRRDVPIEIELVGTVVARESVIIKSRIDSQITNVLFSDGDYVKEGQSLFELDDRAIKANLGELKASLAKEKAQLVNVKRQYERAQTLLKKNVVSQAQVDEAKATYAAQLAQVKAAQATLDNASVQLTYTTIKAPISGRTGTINVTRGNNVKANDAQGLVTINQISPIRVQFAIPQRYYPQVKKAMAQHSGLKIRAHHTESDQQVSGTLDYIENAINTSNGTFGARASFTNDKETLWPGMFVNVTLNLGVKKNVLAVPAQAVQGDDDNRIIYIAEGEPAKAKRTEIQTSLISNDVIVISHGISENDRVIIDGLLKIVDGAPVNITKEVTLSGEDITP